MGMYNVHGGVWTSKHAINALIQFGSCGFYADSMSKHLGVDENDEEDYEDHDQNTETTSDFCIET